MKKSLLDDLKQAAGEEKIKDINKKDLNNKDLDKDLNKKDLDKQVLLSAHFKPEVRKALKLIAIENDKSIKQVLGEAINSICQKYGKPEPYGD